MTIDSFDEFVDFLFLDRPVRFVDIGEDLIFDNQRILDHYAKLFESARSVTSKYSRERINDGFLMTVNIDLPCALPHLLSEAASLDAQMKTIAATVTLYETLFASDPLFGAPFMWWDGLIAGLDLRERPSTERDSILSAIFAALVTILSLPSVVCQKAALHGLNHLRHAQTAAVVSAFMSRGDIQSEVREYAAAAAMGILP